MSHAIANNEKARSQELVPGSGLLMLGAVMRRMPHNEISRSEIELSELLYVYNFSAVALLWGISAGLLPAFFNCEYP